jgi:hypothetical protein
VHPYFTPADLPNVTEPLHAGATAYEVCEALSCALPSGVYITPANEDPATLLHELFHVLDLTGQISWTTRARWLAINHDSRPWWEQADADPPYEQAAESFSFCAHRSHLKHSDILQHAFMGIPAGHAFVNGMGYNWAPTYYQYAKVCALFRSI